MMKKRRTYRWLFVYPFQYIGFQKYLNHMAKKGWKLASIFGNNSCWLTFERTEDRNYYVVDYTKDFSMIVPETETEKAKRYRSFIEEYGYEFVGSNGALQIYRANHENEILRENNDEDYKALLKSSLKSYIPHLLILPLLAINFYNSYQSTKYSLFTDETSLQSLQVIFIFGSIFIIEFVFYLYWFWRKKPIASRYSIIASTMMILISLAACLYSLFSVMISEDLGSIVFLIVICVVCEYYLFHDIDHNSKTNKVLNYVGFAFMCIFTLLFGSMSISAVPSVSQGDIYKDNEEIAMLFGEDVPNGIDVISFENKSFLSQNLSISINYSDDDVVNIDRYKIQNGILKDWIKNQYEKEEYKQIMCPGIKAGTKQNGKWIYEGDESILIVDENTYVIVDKDFELDAEGWEKINHLIEL